MAKFNADFSKAFSPFFDERIGIEGVRPSGRFRGSFAACLFFGENADSLDDLSPSDESTLLTAMVARRGSRAWNLDFDPQVGDILSLSSSRAFAVKSVDSFHDDYYKLEAREVKRAR